MQFTISQKQYIPTVIRYWQLNETEEVTDNLQDLFLMLMTQEWTSPHGMRVSVSLTTNHISRNCDNGTTWGRERTFIVKRSLGCHDSSLMRVGQISDT